METVLAYIDPGSGSLIVQAVIAGIVALPIFFRAQIRRVMHGFRNSDEVATETPSNGSEDNPGGA